jgi:hypothetical protein
MKKCVYQYNQQDEGPLVSALLMGKFNNKSLTLDDIDALRHSKRWKQRYGTFLRKVIHQETTIKANLQKWITSYKDVVDPSGRPVFTKNTVKVTEDQLEKVGHVVDVGGIEMYQEIPPSTKSTHNLPKWQSNRPESSLEHVHGFLAHFPNTGMNKRMADTLTLGGAAEYNVKQRWKCGINEKKLNKVAIGIPRAPRYYDHSFLQYLNKEAKRCGLSPVFADVHQIEHDNGEVFLSKYFEQQMARNKPIAIQDAKTKLCICSTCAIVPESISSPFLVPPPPVVAPLAVLPQPTTTNCDFIPPNALAICMPQVAAIPQHPTTNCVFISPAAMAVSMQTSYNWLPRPNDCCFVTGIHYCTRYDAYLRSKNAGITIFGKPPHDSCCPIRHGASWRPR